jgi:pyruvate kinase
MIESMIEGEKPERAELSEISSVTLNGADCFILSHETSCGKYCAEATV